jgi:UPF0716 protein FxsA
MPLLLAFSIFALLDFILLFSIGSEIGLLMTLALVLGSGFLGLHLIRREGTSTFARARERLERGEMPAGEMMNGAALIFGGALLMAPGFLSDALGFMCLIPDGRRLLGKALKGIGMSLRVITPEGASGQQAGGWHPDDSFGQPSARESGADAPLEGEFIARDERRN